MTHPLWTILTLATLTLGAVPLAIEHAPATSPAAAIPLAASAAPRALLPAANNTTDAQADLVLDLHETRVVVAWRANATFLVDVTNPDPAAQPADLRVSQERSSRIGTGGIQNQGPVGISGWIDPIEGDLAPGETRTVEGLVSGTLPGDHQLRISALGNGNAAYVLLDVCVHDSLLHPCA